MVENVSVERHLTNDTKSEIEASIALMQSKSSIQKLPTFSLLESVYQQSIQICFHNRKLNSVVFKRIACFFFCFVFIQRRIPTPCHILKFILCRPTLSGTGPKCNSHGGYTCYKGMQCDYRHSSNKYFLGGRHKWSGL